MRRFRRGRWKNPPSGRNRVEAMEMDRIRFWGSGSKFVIGGRVCGGEKSVEGGERRERRGVDKTTP